MHPCESVTKGAQASAQPLEAVAKGWKAGTAVGINTETKVVFVWASIEAEQVLWCELSVSGAWRPFLMVLSCLLLSSGSDGCRWSHRSIVPLTRSVTKLVNGLGLS